MIEKTSLFKGEGEFGPTVIPLFNRHTDGFFEKTASTQVLPEVLQYIEAVRPQNNSCYVLVNALGASEYYSSNVNADAFPESALIHRPDKWTGNPIIDKVTSKDWAYGFPTFYYAHPFGHHRNKDATKAFGEVELAAWNPRMKRVELVTRVDKDKCQQFGGEGIWDKLKAGNYIDVSMGSKVPYDLCFPAGTLVRTSSGQVPIESISVGDTVLSHTGTLRAVKQTMQHTADGVVRVRASGLPDVRATENHPFFVLRRDDVRTCKGSANGQRLRHTFEDGSSECRRCKKNPKLEFQWAAAESLQVGDYLAVPASSAPGEDVAPARARLLGYYLGDGYILKQRTGKKKDGPHRDMGFGFSAGLIEEEHIQRILHTVVEAGCSNEPRVYDAGCGRQAKIISVYDQTTAAWLEEYGGRTSRGKRLHDRVFGWSREAKLELVAGYVDTDGSVDERGQTRIGSVNRGLLLDVQRLLLTEGVVATVCFAGTITAGFGQGTESWYLVLSTAQSQKLLGRSTKIQAVDVTWESPRSFFWGGYWLTPVTALELEEAPTPVFNISVDVDESYVAEGRAVHNCSICTDWVSYHAAQATFDPAKHRQVFEAVIAYHKNVRPIRGLSITTRDYCEDMKRNRNKILADGRKVFVYNDYPRFFDISFVFIGADRTAKTMIFISRPGMESSITKMGQPIVNTDGFERLNVKLASLKQSEDKSATIVKDDVPSNMVPAAVAAVSRDDADLPRGVLNELASHPLEQALSTAGAMGIVLRPREFQRVILVSMGYPNTADELEEKGRVFSREPADEGYKPDNSAFIPELVRALLPFLLQRSALHEPLVRRVALRGWREKEASTAQAVPSLLSEPLRKISSIYSAYRESLMDSLAHAPALFSHLPTEFGEAGMKLAAANTPHDFFSTLTVEYVKTAFWDEAGPLPHNKRA